MQEIEKRLKTEIQEHGINTVFDIDGKKLKELFLPEHFNKVIEIAQNIVKNYNSDSFTNVQNHEYRLTCEQTKQKQYDVEITSQQTKQKQYDAEITAEQTKQKQYDAEITAEQTKQKEFEIQILQLRIELETRKRKADDI